MDRSLARAYSIDPSLYVRLLERRHRLAVDLELERRTPRRDHRLS
jgi:hypothetical protein